MQARTSHEFDIFVRIDEAFEVFKTVAAEADINVIDHARIALKMPHVVHDLPAGGRRITQRATGYRATIVTVRSPFSTTMRPASFRAASCGGSRTHAGKSPA